MSVMSVPELRRRLKQHRLERHWSYDELAVAIGPHVSAATVRRFIEGEHKRPYATTVHAVERYLGSVEREAVAS